MKNKETPFDRAVREFRVAYILDAVMMQKGNICRAANVVGSHRNTLQRILDEGGYNSKLVKAMLREKKLKEAHGNRTNCRIDSQHEAQ